MSNEIFSLNDENELLKKCYEQEDNYCVEVLNNERKVCIIFFSGNGLYYPNEKGVFYETVLQNNRYEWWTIGHSEEIAKYAKKIIYVRDVYKQFYIKGINKEINCIDKLCNFLKELTEGYQVVTCGNSAGGYIATIVGMYLKAIKVYNFGGQFTLEHLLKRKAEPAFNDSYYFIRIYENDSLYNQFFDIVPIIEKSSTPILYFYSGLNKDDKEQIEHLKGFKAIDNVYCFAMQSEYHGYLMHNQCYKKLLSLDKDRVMELHQKYESKLISLRKWDIEILDKRQAMNVIIEDIIHSHKSLQIIFKGQNRQ